MAKNDKNSLLNIHYSRTMTSDNLSKAANYVGKYVLKGLGAFGKIMTAPFVQQGPTSATIYKSKELLAKERTIENKSEELLGKAMTWASPLNYGVALATGNGLNARKGEEEVASWSPAWLAVGRLGELYVGPKAVKGVKSAPRVVVNTAAKAGSKTAKAAVVAREIKLATKNKPNLSNRTYTENNGNYTLFSPFGEDIGNLLTTKPLTSEMKGKGISMIASKNKGKGVSEDLYNIAVEDSKTQGYPGLESGHDLFRPKLTMHVTDKFPKIETPNVSLLNINGKWLFAPDLSLPPIRLLTGTSGKPLPNFIQELTNHRIDLETLKNLLSIKFNEITGDFEEVPIKKNIKEPSTSLKFFERGPAKISEAEKAGVPKGERFKNKKHYTGIGRNYRGTLFGEENIPKDIEYVEPITSGKKFGESDYSFENRKYATKQYLKELNNRDSGIFSDKGVESIKKYISLLPDDLNSNFINTNGLLSFYIRDFRLYLNDLGYRAGDLTDTEIAKLLTNLYDILSKTLTGKLKGKVVFHSGPNFFDLFDFTHTGETMGNMGYLGPGNYFSTKPSIYGGKGNYTTQDLIGQYRYPRRLPYLINNIKSTPVSGELKRAKIIPEYTSPPRETYGDASAKNNYILLVIQPLVKSTKVRDMAVLDDISVSPHSLYTNGVQTEFMVPRNTGIKSLYPHPSLFIEDANGKITLNRNWNDIRVNYKQGGKMNIIKQFKKGGQVRKMQTAAGGPIYWLRKRLYNNIEPFGYNEAGSRLIDAVVLNKNEHNNFKGDYSDTERAPALYLTIDNIWGEYLHIPEKERRYSNGKYKIKNNGNGTFSLPFESMEDIMQAVNSNNPLLWGQRGKLGNSVVGEYDVHRGYDKNGDYLKYIDHWRINPYDVKEDKEYGLDNNSLLKWYFKGKDDASFGLGTPVEIQGKYYLDDIYNVKGKDRGGHYLPEVVVIGNKKKQGGKMNILEFLKNGSGIHIKEENKGKFTSYCGGKVTNECILKGKNSSNPAIRKRATFAANARKWKHQFGGIIPGTNNSLDYKQQGVLALNYLLSHNPTAATMSQWVKGTLSYLTGIKDSDLIESKYTPSKASSKNAKYYTRKGLDYDVMRNLLGGKESKAKEFDGTPLYYKNFNDLYTRLSNLNGKQLRTTDNSHLGEYTIGIGQDKNGRYVSYYDKFDWAPKESLEIFSPYEIYNRIYEKDFNRMLKELNNETYSGSNPSGNWFFKSGINNKGYFKFGGKTANARKWKHEDGGTVHNGIKKHYEGAKLTFGLKLENLANSDLGKSFISNGLSFLSDKLSDTLFNKSASSNLEIALAAQEKELPTIDPTQVAQMIEMARNQYADPENPNANGGDIFNSYIKRQITAPILARQLEEHKKRLAAIDLLTNQAKSSAIGTFFNTLAQGGIEYLLNKYGKTEKADS